MESLLSKRMKIVDLTKIPDVRAKVIIECANNYF